MTEASKERSEAAAGSSAAAQSAAVTVVGLLADEDRFRVAGAIALGHGTLGDIAAVTGLPLPVVGKAVARLASGGLVIEESGSYSILVEELHAIAREGSQRPEEDFDAPPEAAVVLRRFIREGKLNSIPLVRSKRLVILDHLAQEFEPGKYYSEAEVNETLAAYHPDVAALRRHLVDENFMTRDMGIYWRSGGSFD
jgi:hypothetical protein